MEKIAAGVFLPGILCRSPRISYGLFCKQAKSRRLGVKVEVLGETQMRRLGMGALLGVGQGSVRGPRWWLCSGMEVVEKTR